MQLSRLILTTYIVLSIALATTPAAQAIEVGEPVGEITATLIDGATFKLSEHRGEVVMINFWAAWCEPCRAEMPILKAYYLKHRGEGFYLLGINMDDPADQAIAIKVAGEYHFPVALRKDSDYKTLGRIWRMPSTFVIDKNGILRKNGSKGVPVIDQSELDSLVTPLLH